METFAYLHLCTVHEEADLDPGAGELKLFQGFNWQPPSSAWIRLTSIVMALSILSLANSASAYTARVSTNGSPLNVRTGPGLIYRVVDTLPNGKKISLNGNRSDSWSQLSKVRDWVSSYWIRRVGSGSGYRSSSSRRTIVVYRNRYSPYVASLQRSLQDLGYFPGAITGFYGNQTDSAVKAYQARYGESTNGILALLVANNSSTGGGGTEGGGTVTGQVCYGGIFPSGTGSLEVARLQEHLRGLGYYQNQVTAIYDQATDNAVASFQQNNQYRLSLSTNCNTNRQATLKVAQKAWAAQYSNVSVARLQDRLRLLGYLDGQTTGYYDRTTKAAVQSFQYNYSTQYGLQATGSLDQKTLKAVAQEYNNSIKAAIGNNASNYGQYQNGGLSSSSYNGQYQNYGPYSDIYNGQSY